MRPFALSLIALLLVASAASADTIVLKNGRRITASNVIEDADHVTYDTPAGQMSIPKSIVDRIDRDGFTASSHSSASSEPPVSAPAIEPVRGYEEISAFAVHDDSIDFSYIAKLELEARSGGKVAAKKPPPLITPPLNFSSAKAKLPEPSITIARASVSLPTISAFFSISLSSTFTKASSHRLSIP